MLRLCEINGRVCRVARRRTTLQKREHAAELRVRLTATQLLGHLQPYHPAISIDQSANFFSPLMSKRNQSHLVRLQAIRAHASTELCLPANEARRGIQGSATARWFGRPRFPALCR